MATLPGEHTPEYLANAVIDHIVIDEESFFTVGYSGVTRIDAFTKSGMHADIPYVRVWRGDAPCAEFCQHNIVGVYFAGAK